MFARGILVFLYCLGSGGIMEPLRDMFVAGGSSGIMEPLRDMFVAFEGLP